MSRIGQLLLCKIFDRLFFTLPYRSVDHPCLAKPASAGTSTKGFHHATVVNRIDKGNDVLYREFRLVQIFYNSSLHAIRSLFIKFFDFFDRTVLIVYRLIKRRHIDALQFAGPLQKLLFRITFHFQQANLF